MDKTIKKLILILLIIIILIISCILLIKNKKQEQIEQEAENELLEAEEIKSEEIKMETAPYMYLYSNGVMNNFFNYVSEKEKKADNKEAIISLLDQKYIKKNNITKENVFKILEKYRNIHSYSTKEIYSQEINQRQNAKGKNFYIKGILRKAGKEQYIYILFKQDFTNSTYSISFLTEDEFNKKEEDNLEQQNIVKNDYNAIYTKTITDYQICLEYLNDYLNTIKNNPREGYKLLNDEYKNKRFGSIENYLKYINNNKFKINNAILKEYSIEEVDGQTQYICRDQRGNYYIFKKYKMMEYNLILDTYTLDLPQFIDKYNKANNTIKTGYNIERCIEAINNKDYLYVYNKLDSKFKEKNYKTLESFVETIKKKMFESNKAEKVSATNEGNIYIYRLVIKDTDNQKNKQNLTIIMKLEENTDFVMSFSFV